MEGVLAAFAQFDNDVRSARTRAGMKAAPELWRLVFLAPIGYLNAPRSMGKSLDGSSLVGELDDHMALPRPAACSVSKTAGVVVGEAAPTSEVRPT